MKSATFVLSFISCAASVTTLVVVLVGGKKMKEEMDDVRSRTTKTVNNLKTAIEQIDI